MPVGAQDVRQHEGVARIAFAASDAVAGPASFDDVGMDRDNRLPGSDQRLDDQAGWPLYGDGQLGRRCDALEPDQHVGQAVRIMTDLNADDDLAGLVDDADSVAGAALVQTSVKWRVMISSGCSKLA